MVNNPNSNKDKKNPKENDQEENSEASFDFIGEGKARLGDLIGKVVTTGMSAAFMTEESIRSYLGDAKLPKELLNILIQGASKGKDEITQRVSKEMINILNKIDWVKELSKFAETHKFKITAEIDITKKKPADE